MLGLGLTVATKILNSYVPEMRPSINKPITIQKIRSSFPEINKLMKADFTGHRLEGDMDYLDWHLSTRARDYQDYLLPDMERNRRGNMDFRMCPSVWPDGPMPKWEKKGYKPKKPRMEIFMTPGDLMID